jgi:putative SOS response-associated peptidase YedK
MLSFLDDHFEASIDQYDGPLFNVAPGSSVLSVLSYRDKYKVGYIKWGFQTDFGLVINARSESMYEKVLFKNLIEANRCVILSDGFYEWDHKNKSKNPYYLVNENKEMRAYAGLWRRVGKNYEVIIITKEAKGLISDIHDRLPVILNVKQAKEWMQQSSSLETLKELISSSIVPETMIRVSKDVNKVTNDSDKLIEEYIDHTLF